MPTKTAYENCDAHHWGKDCAFDASLFSTVTMVVWILTAIPLLLWALPCRWRRCEASWKARASLTLAALSALCCAADEVLKFQLASYGNQTLHTFGTIFLVFSFAAFSLVWCDVASATCRLHAPGSSAMGTISRIRSVYKCTSFLHVPFAVMFTLHDYELMAGSYNTVVRVWGAWVIFGTVFVLSGLAGVQFHIARSSLGHVPSARSLQDTALINLMEQLFFDISLVVYATLYLTDSKSNGGNIAAYHSVGFLTFWAMHVQVLLFFAVLGNTDPLYSKEGLDELLVNAWASGQKDEVPAAHVQVGTPPSGRGSAAVAVPPTAVGSPSQKDGKSVAMV